MNTPVETSPAPRLPARHPQWQKLDLADILTLPTAYIAINYVNTGLSPKGGAGARAVVGAWPHARRCAP